MKKDGFGEDAGRQLEMEIDICIVMKYPCRHQTIDTVFWHVIITEQKVDQNTDCTLKYLS